MVSPSNHCISDLLCSPDLSVSLQTMIQLIFFNCEAPGNMTVHLASAESQTGHVWRGGSRGWQPIPVRELSSLVMRRAADALFDMRNHYMYDINDVHRFRNDLYLDVHDTPPSLVRRLETIETLAECSGVVAGHHAPPSIPVADVKAVAYENVSAR